MTPPNSDARKLSDSELRFRLLRKRAEDTETALHIEEDKAGTMTALEVATMRALRAALDEACS